MKTTTLDDILALRTLMLQKTEENKNLIRAVENIRNRYKIMDIHELNDSVKSVVTMNKTIEENKRWIENAKKKINAFFAPAKVA